MGKAYACCIQDQIRKTCLQICFEVICAHLLTNAIQTIKGIKSLITVAIDLDLQYLHSNGKCMPENYKILRLSRFNS